MGRSQSHTEDLLDEALTETFPASDPIAIEPEEEISAGTKADDKSWSQDEAVAEKCNGDHVPEG